MEDVHDLILLRSCLKNANLKIYFELGLILKILEPIA